MENIESTNTKTKRNIFVTLYEFSNSWTGTIIIVLTVIFFIAQAFVIPSGSMKNTLLIGDNLFVKKFVYGVPTPHLPWIEIPLIPGTDGHLVDGDEPERGDIVIFRYPINPKIHYVKRCVAKGGDMLFIRNKDLYVRMVEGDEYMKERYPEAKFLMHFGRLWIKNPYTKEHSGIHHDKNVTIEAGFPEGIFNLSPIRIPEGEYFMMGDNRDHSNDSRFWGTVPYGLLEGTPWFIYFSLNDNYEIRWDRMFKQINTLERKLEASKEL